MKRAAALLLTFLAGCSPQSFFYYPNRNLYVDPLAMGLKYDILSYPSLDGKSLAAILIKTDQPPKGTVVHFHGNFGNLSNHFPLSVFLVKNGFDVLIFDYQGYGGSQGHPTPERTVGDGIATVRFAQSHLRNPKTGVVIFGQSLGAAVGAVVAAKEPEVKAAVLEAGFTSYAQMGKEALKRSAWTWLFSFLTPALVTHRYDAQDYVAQISPRPVLFIHGDKDHIVPLHMSEDLYARAKEPKRLWIISGADHLEGHRIGGKLYDDTVVKFFEDALRPATNTSAR